MDIFEAMNTCRAIREYTDQPVDGELIDSIIHAATRAPSPGNSQGWDFVVVTDPDTRATLGDGISSVMTAVVARATEAFGGAENIDATQRRMLDGTLNLASQLRDIPVHVLVCGRAVYPPHQPSIDFVWSALYPAAQNILLAARAHGLGTCLTTYHRTCEPLIRDTLAIPDDVHIACYIPIGWPAVPFGPLTRNPITDTIHRDRW
jgi:nitroreductase